MRILQDNYGRTFSYLRLSLTDACNFRCQYCLPNGYQKRAVLGDPFEDSVLAASEVENLVRGFAALGFKKVRLTGGEPTLRTDILEIVERVRHVPGINTVALTTNGYRLDKLATPLRNAGLNAINISLDSLNPQHFKAITGSRNFRRVFAGVEQALSVGIERVKINVVLLRSYVDKDLPSLLDFVRTAPVSLRFIELMETGGNSKFFSAEHVSGNDFLTRLASQGWNEISRGLQDGPARELVHPDYVGRLGIIAPYSKDFCANCNRLRVSARGEMKLCLFGYGEISLRRYLQGSDQRQELVEVVRGLIREKAPSHRLHDGIFGSTQHLASIGG